MFLLYLFEEWIRKKKKKSWPAIAARALRKVQVAQSLQLDYVSCIIKKPWPEVSKGLLALIGFTALTETDRCAKL